MNILHFFPLRVQAGAAGRFMAIQQNYRALLQTLLINIIKPKLIYTMGNKFCGHEVAFSHFIEEQSFQPFTGIDKLNLQARGIDFMKSNDLKPWVSRNGEKYFCGTFRNGRAEGPGIVYIPNHFYYEGNLKNGLPDGLGILKSFNKSEKFEEYEGNFSNGVAHGRGKFSSAHNDNNFFFDGEWQNSEAVKGKLYSRCQGQLDYIQFSKSGNLIKFKNGDTYEGDLNAYFEPHGLGTFTYSTSNPTQQYVGQWFKGKFNGNGRCIWRDGSCYAGQYCNGEKQGQGKFIFASKKYYNGHWLEGMQHGLGTLYDEHGKELQKGIWMKGKIALKVNKDEQKNFLFQNLPKLHGNQTDVSTNNDGHQMTMKTLTND